MAWKRLFLSLTVLLLVGAAANAQAVGGGRQRPSMPRVWDKDAPGWIDLGLGPNGLMAAFSHQEKNIIATLHGGCQWESGKYFVGNLGLTVGLPLTRGHLFAAVGGGVGCLVGWLDPSNKITKGTACLDGDLQLFLRFNSRIGLGLYSTLAVSSKKTLGGIFLSLQYGRWKE